MVPLLFAAAHAAGVPCYGHTYDNRADSEHFWVEWADGAIPLGHQEVVLQAAEDARQTYKRDLGYRVTDEPIVISVQSLTASGTSGITQTRDCVGHAIPAITLDIGRWDDDAVAEVTAHEIGHVVQYAYMGSYADSVASWLWWMEGHATWLTPHATNHWGEWADIAQGYLDRAALPLQHDVFGFGDADASYHMYGTAFVVEALAAWAGDDAVRATWEWGKDHAGSPIFFPDAIAGVGQDFDTFWADYLARLPTLDVSRPKHLGAPAAVHTANELPDSGSYDGPGGLGAQIVWLPEFLGAHRRAAAVTFDGDPSIPWHVVLARTREGAVLDYTPLEVTSGHAEGTLHGFDQVDGWIVVSPNTPDALARA
ncbi:MAG TPA: hypothetical protein PKA64_14705, partial [Myxococcota bacterium]|nr:hypothetical protein [Myxococcota bacterium]